MNVSQLLDELWIVPDIEVVVALLPEVATPIQAKSRLEWATYE